MLVSVGVTEHLEVENCPKQFLLNLNASKSKHYALARWGTCAVLAPVKNL